MDSVKLTLDEPQSTLFKEPVALPTFEFQLLRLARFCVGAASADSVVKILTNRTTTPPPVLSAVCLRLLKDTLAKGVMLWLVRAGGWRRERFLRRNAPVLGRVWERIPLDERILEFSPAPVEFLMWLTREDICRIKEPPGSKTRPQTAADEVFFLMVLDAFEQIKDFATIFPRFSPFQCNPLCWLAHPAAVAPNEQIIAPDFTDSFSGTRLAVLECLQAYLTQRWIASERNKGVQTDWTRMRQTGLAEQAVLINYLMSADEAKRWDLARFVLKTNSTIILSQTDPMPSYWIGSLRANAPNRLADRLDTHRAALSVVRQMMTLRDWNRRAKTIGHFDDDYESSQLWKVDWEAAQGDLVAARAQKILERIEPLRA